MLVCEEVNAEMSSHWLVTEGEQAVVITYGDLRMKELYTSRLVEWKRPRAHSCFPGQSHINPEQQHCFECTAFSATLSLPPLAPLITTWVAYPIQVDYAFLLIDYSWHRSFMTASLRAKKDQHTVCHCVWEATWGEGGMSGEKGEQMTQVSLGLGSACLRSHFTQGIC